MANETYRLALLLEGKDAGASSVVAKLYSNLEKLDNVSRRTQTGYGNLLKTLNRQIAYKSGSKLLQTLDAIEKKSKTAGSQLGWLKNKADNLQQSAGGANKLASAIGNIEKRSESAVSSVEKLRNKAAGLDDGLPRRRKSGKSEIDRILEEEEKQRRKNSIVGKFASLNDNYLDPARQIKDIWKQNYDSLKIYTDEAEKLARVQARFKLFNLSPAENQKAFNSIDQTTKSVRGISKYDATEVYTAIYNALDSTDLASQMMPFASKYRVAAGALYADKFTPEQINDQIFRGFKFLELTGANKSREMMESRFDTLVKILNSTGGEVTFNKILAMGKQASPIMQTVSDTGIRNVTSAVDVMGADRVGTALSALNRAWVGGVMPAYVAKRYQELGLIDESPGSIQYSKAGNLVRVNPGANKLGQTFQDDPVAAAAMLREAIVKDAQKKGISVEKTSDMNKYLRGLASTETQYRLLNEFINNAPQLVKESARADKSMGVSQTYETFKNSDLVKIEEYKAAMASFRAEVGTPLLKTATEIGKVIAPIARFFGDNPEMAQWTAGVLIAAKAINIFGQSASILNSTGGGLISYFTRSGNAAAVAGDKMEGAAKKAGGLRGALSGLGGSRTISIVASIASIIGLEMAISAAVQKAIEANKAEQNRTNLRRGTGDELSKTEADFAGRGEKVPKSIYRLRAQSALADFNQNGLMTNAAGGGTSWDKITNRIQSDALTMLYGGFFAKGYLSLYNNLVPSATEKMFGWRMPEVNTLYNPFTGKHGNVRNPYETFSGGFNKQKATEDFRQRTDLKSPQVMLEMLRLIQERIPKEAQQPIKESLQQAHPSAFAEAMQLFVAEQRLGLEQMKQSFMAFNQILPEHARAFQTVNQSLFDLANPIGQTQQSFSNLPAPVDQSAQSLFRVRDSATGASGSLDSLTAKIESWQPPQPPSYSAGFMTGAPVNQQGTFTVPGRAIGGIVERDGLAMVHAGNAITPARVTRGIHGVNDLFAFARNANGNERDKGFRNSSASAVSRNPDEPRNKLLVFAALDADAKRSRNPVTNIIHAARDDDNFSKSAESSMFAPSRESSVSMNFDISDLSGTASQGNGNNLPPININYSPNVSLHGDAQSAKAEVEKLLAEHSARMEADLERLLERIVRIGREKA